MASTTPDTRTLLALKAAVTGTTLVIAGGMASTSFQFMPSLIAAAQKAPRPSTTRQESGRLTPQPSESKQLGAPTPAGSGYKMPAQQFVAMSKTAFATQVPPELLSIAVAGYLAYNASISSVTGKKWAAVAVLIASVFPLTGGFMVPIDHKIAQIGGEEEKPEPYEDAPLDREAERKNTVEFLSRWNVLNLVRSGVMFAAGGVGLWGLIE